MAVRLSLTLRHPLLPTSYPIPVRATQFRRFAVQNCVSDSDDSRKVLTFHSLSSTFTSRVVHIACREIYLFSVIIRCWCVVMLGFKLRPQTSFMFMCMWFVCVYFLSIELYVAIIVLRVVIWRLSSNFTSGWSCCLCNVVVLCVWIQIMASSFFMYLWFVCVYVLPIEQYAAIIV